MKILHFSNKPVFPKIDGGCAAMAAILKSLAETGNDVHHVCISTEKHPFSPEAYPEEICLPFSAGDSFVSTKITVAGALRALISGRNFNLSRFWSNAFAEKLRSLLKQEQYDAVILDSAFLVGYIGVIKSACRAKVILRSHNVEFQLWEQQAAAASGLKKLYLSHLAKTLKKEELAGLSECDTIWAISAEDAQQLRFCGIKTGIEVIPFALAIPEEMPDYKSADFMHFGSMNWLPNRVSLEYLLHKIWPEANVNAKLHVAGSFSSPVESDENNVVFHGFVDDPVLFLQSNGSLLAPLQSGSGVRIKLLEAMAAGVPCVTTKIGAAGIENPEDHLLIAESKAEWLEIIRKLHSSAADRETLGTKGRAYIRKSHSFEAVNEKIKRSFGR